MPRILLQILDLGFLIFHTALVLFNVFGWAFRATRKANLLTLLLTLFSWVAMGMFYGIGYCVCTEWHYRVRRALGYETQGNSYIQFLVWKLTGWLPPAGEVKTLSGVIFVACLVLSVGLNLRDWRNKKAGPSASEGPAGVS